MTASCVWQAGFQGRASIAKMLIDHGLDPSNRHRDGFTPLHRSCWGSEQRHTDTARVLLEAGVPPGQRATNGQRPAEMARRKETRDLILEYQAKRDSAKKAEL